MILICYIYRKQKIRVFIFLFQKMKWLFCLLLLSIHAGRVRDLLSSIGSALGVSSVDSAESSSSRYSRKYRQVQVQPLRYHYQSDPNESSHLSNGISKDYLIPNFHIPEGLAIRYIFNGVSQFNLYGLPPILPYHFKIISEAILNFEKAESIQSLPPPLVTQIDRNVYLIQCFSPTGKVFGTILAMSKTNLRAPDRCLSLRQTWEAVAGVCQVEPTANPWKGYWRIFQYRTSFEFADNAFDNPIVYKRFATIVI